MRKLYAAIVLSCLVAGTAQAAEGGSFIDRLRGYFGFRDAGVKVSAATTGPGGQTGRLNGSGGGRTANSTASPYSPTGGGPTCTCTENPEREPSLPPCWDANPDPIEHRAQVY